MPRTPPRARTPRTTRVSETFRERETFKYDALALSTARLHGSQPAPPISSSSLSAAPDPGLTAFAQLGLYRLKAGRSLISLFDRRYQHIVAEAIRPPEPGKPPLPPFNALAFERVTSVCEHVVTGDAKSHTVPGTESGLTVTDVPVSIINHLDSDARFCQIQDPARQFYAGVPIRSPAGVNIGVYCVFDETPRPQGLQEEEVHFIRDLSLVIMDYLAYKRSHEWYHREQRMMRGLAGFVEGEAGLPAPEAPAERKSSPSGQRPDRGGGTESSKTPQASLATAPTTLLHHKDTLPPVGGAPSDERTPHTEANSGTALPARPPSTKAPTGRDDESCSGIGKIFSRAANMIRESLEVEGVVFLDANIRSYGGLVGNMSAPLLAPGDAEARNSSMESGSSDESPRGPGFDPPDAGPAMSRVLGFSTARASSITGDTGPSELSACRERFLDRLLQRYPKGRIFNFEADGALSDHSTGSEGDDRALGSSAASSTVTPPLPTDYGGGNPAVRPRTRPSAAERVVRLFPGARSVAVVPLWDPQTGRVFAGGFLWTRTPTRIFSRENELSYLRVFGLAIMAEVARQKSRAADKAKTDLLGSISHELRTPLHGLVGTIEMLRNTALDGFQKSVLWTLDTSARTLLDIVDHLLDFIKVNNAPSSSRSKRRAGAPPGQLTQPKPVASSALSMLEPSGVVPLDLFVEEVLESVLAGSSYMTMSNAHLHPPSRPGTASSQAMIPPPSAISHHTPDGVVFSSRGQILIYLDIDHLADWSFRVHPGALRRIVMNLFGNSLKFTQSGFIRVSLRQELQSKRKMEAGLMNVTLTVSDSGRGIGEDYMRDHLFNPFSQEDEFAPGTGLGLNLVHRMVSAVGGSIQVASKVGEGTTITVVLPLPQVAASESDDGEQQQQQQRDAEFRGNVQTLTGRRIRLRHFETDTRIRPGFFSAEDAKQPSQFQLMKRMCEGVLHMTVLSGDEDSEPPPDFIVSLTTDIEGSLDKTRTERLMDAYPHVLICEDLASAYGFMSLRGDESRYEVQPQPVGPRKLARSLISALSHWQEVRGDSGADGPGPNSAVQASQALVTEEDKLPLAAEVSFEEHGSNPGEQGQETVDTGPVSSLPIPLPEDTTSPISKQFLPLQEAAIPSQSPHAASDVLPRQKSILVVDDNAVNLRILAAYLGRLKYHCTTAENGLDALQLYASEPSRYSCVLTDISMPVMDGLELTRRIRELERLSGRGRGRDLGGSVLVIALTGLGAAVEQDAIVSGVDLFLTRPLMFAGLRDALIAVGLTQGGS